MPKGALSTKATKLPPEYQLQLELAQTRRALELACMQILMLDGKDTRTYQEWVEWCLRQAEGNNGETI